MQQIGVAAFREVFVCPQPIHAAFELRQSACRFRFRKRLTLTFFLLFKLNVIGPEFPRHKLNGSVTRFKSHPVDCPDLQAAYSAA